MAHPYKGRYVVTQTYLNKSSRYTSGYHLGIDLVGLDDKDIYAIRSGVVQVITNNDAYGQTVVAKMDNGLYSRYSHLDEVYVKIGQKIAEGITKIGIEGKSGFVVGTGDLRHLDLRISRYPYHTNSVFDYYNPADYLGIPNIKDHIVTPEKEGEDDIVVFKDAIICKEGVDEYTSGLLSDKLNAPVILYKYLEGLTPKQIENIAVNIYQVGISEKVCDKAEVFAIGNRWTTVQEVLNHILKIK